MVPISRSVAPFALTSVAHKIATAAAGTHGAPEVRPHCRQDTHLRGIEVHGGGGGNKRAHHGTRRARARSRQSRQYPGQNQARQQSRSRTPRKFTYYALKSSRSL